MTLLFYNMIVESAKKWVMSDEEYFGKGLPGYISNSRMGLINPAEGGSVTRYQKGFEDTKSDYFILGSAIHALVLEADKYKLSEMTAPSGAGKMIIDMVHKLTTRDKSPLSFDEALDLAVKYFNYYGGELSETRRNNLISSTKGYYDYLCHFKTDDEIILNPDMKATALVCVERVLNNTEAVDLYKGESKEIEEEFEFLLDDNSRKYFNEDVITCDYITKSGKRLPLKCKIDSWSIDVENKTLWLTDLKTTSSNAETFMGQHCLVIEGYCDMNECFIHGSFHKYHYYRQMYMYLEMLKAYAKKEYGFDDTWTVNVNMIVVETTNLNRSFVYFVDSNLLEAGKIEMEYLLDMIGELQDNPVSLDSITLN